MGSLRHRQTLRRAQAEDGFTMVELLVIIAIVGILVTIAISSYLGYTSRAADSAAKANIRAAVPSVVAYYNDNSTYAGMTVAALKSGYDSGIAPGVSFYSSPTATSYCLTATAGGHTWSVLGPAATSAYKSNGTCS
jgi:type IV pilus assembly protein PilA